MKVKDVMSYQPLVADAFDTVQAAAQKMRAYVVGVLPVLERGCLVGVVTDRDLAMRVVAAGERPWETYVREVMTHAPATCHPDEQITVAAERMQSRRVRRLVVVDETGEICGLLSVDDLIMQPQTQPLAEALLRGLASLRGELDGELDEGAHP